MTKTFLLAAAVSTAAVAAQASTLTVENQTASVFGPNGNKSMTITDNGRSFGARVGAFAVKGGTLGDFIAFCLDIDNYLGLPSTYEATVDSPGYTPYPNTTPLSLARKSMVQQLFDTAYATLDLTKDRDSVGFQLALWEVVNESDIQIAAGNLDISSGNFRADGYNEGEVFADQLLAGLNGPVTQPYRLTFLESATDATGKQYSQNLVTAAPIPLPASALLLIGAFGGLAAMRKRRRAA